MKVLKSWLEKWVDLSSINNNELLKMLESLGYEIEDISNLKPDYKNIVIGEVTEISTPVNADKIRLTTVDVGDESLQIICGAWNFNQGDLVAVAKPGSYIKDKFKIESKNILGYESNGMICSPSELNLWNDQDGILKLSDQNMIKGALLETCYNSTDTMIDLSVTPNRGDSMSHYGLARELSTKINKPLKVIDSYFNSDILPTRKVSNGTNSGSTSYFGMEIENIEIKDSSLDIRFKLSSVGVRPINNFVDATNYIMFDLGQPLHVFDRDKLDGLISVRKSKAKEIIKTLDGVKRTLTNNDIIVTDNDKPIALAGVMGGYETQVSKATKNVLIESANFNSVNIMNTSRSLNLISEASMRFERGVDNQIQENALSEFRKCILNTNENITFSLITGNRDRTVNDKIINFDRKYFLQIIGVEISDKEIRKILKGLGFVHELAADKTYDITVPSWRYDIDRDIDIVEELARHLDFDSFPSTISYGNNFTVGNEWKDLQTIANYLTSSGFYECYNLSFISKNDSNIFTPERNLVSVSNPLDETQEFLRTTSTSQLVKNTVNNINLGNNMRPLYEIGICFNNIPSEIDKNIPEQVNYLSLIIPEKITPNDRREKDMGVDIFYISSVLEGLTNAKISYEQINRPGLHSKQSFTMFNNEVNIGWFGKLSETSKEYFGLKLNIYLAEINLDKLLDLEETQYPFNEISNFPFIKFDLSFELQEDLSASNLLEYIFDTFSEFENSSYIFDEFFSPDTNKRTIGLRIKLRSFDKTIEDHELSDIRKNLIKEITSTFPAILKDYE
jgi:phenylalanyl-tRNA synthetase beta chain